MIGRSAQRIVLALERRSILGHQQPNDLDRLLEHLHAICHRRERDAELAVFLLEPRRPDPELEASVRHVVQGDRLGREDGRMTVRHPGDHGPQPDPLGARGQRGQQRPRLETRAARVAVQGLEVVEHPRRREAGVLGIPGSRQELRPFQLVLRHVQVEPHGTF